MENPKEYTLEEVADIEKSRTISDAELLKGGARYEVDEQGDKHLINVNIRKIPHSLEEIEAISERERIDILVEGIIYGTKPARDYTGRTVTVLQGIKLQDDGKYEGALVRFTKTTDLKEESLSSDGPMDLREIKSAIKFAAEKMPDKEEDLNKFLRMAEDYLSSNPEVVDKTKKWITQSGRYAGGIG